MVGSGIRWPARPVGPVLMVLTLGMFPEARPIPVGSPVCPPGLLALSVAFALGPVRPPGLLLAFAFALQCERQGLSFLFVGSAFVVPTLVVGEVFGSFFATFDFSFLGLASESSNVHWIVGDGGWKSHLGELSGLTVVDDDSSDL